MIARFPAKCFMCGLPIVVGTDHYDVANKRSVHVLCEIENPEEQINLAIRLGYWPHERRDLLPLSITADSRSTGRHEPEARGRLNLRELQETLDCIRPKGGHA
jgi:hypothetical protein